MRKSFYLLSMTLLLTIGIAAQQPAPAKGKAVRKAAAAKSTASGKPAPFKAVASVKDLMEAIIDPASDLVFDAVSTTMTDAGPVEKEPKTDEDWASVRKGALLMIEGSNLMMINGRHMDLSAAADEKPQTENGRQIVNTAAQMEAMVQGNRKVWNGFAQGLIEAATASLKAADKRDPVALLESGDSLDSACENCHLHFWYPDQVRLLDAADKVLRQRKPS